MSCFCTNCGTAAQDNQKFCSVCGTALSLPQTNTPPVISQVQSTPQQQDVPQQYMPQQQYTSQKQYANIQNPYQSSFSFDPDVAAFIQKKQNYYLSKFRNMREKGSKISWNWAAFFFNAFWFAYRKMYGLAAALVMISFVINIMPPAVRIISLIVAVFTAMFANHFYENYIHRKLNTVQATNIHNKQTYILSNGGTSVAGLIFVIVANIILTMVSGAISNDLYYYYFY